jgi:hypothetical protein
MLTLSDTCTTTKPVSQFATSELNSPVTAASEATSHMYSTSDVVAAGTSVMMISATTTTIKSPLSEYQSLSNTSLTIGMLTYKCVIVYKNKSITTFEFLQDEQPSSLVTFRAEQIIL